MSVSVTVGAIDEAGHPTLSFFLHGVAHEPPGIKYEGLVDTGFTGFVQIPFAEACKLRLPLEGIVKSTLADGSTVNSLTALGRATIIQNGNSLGPKLGTVTVSPSPTILIGMEFLRAFDQGLGIFGGSVFLIPDPHAAQGGTS